jgi:hypothetical protein
MKKLYVSFTITLSLLLIIFSSCSKKEEVAPVPLVAQIFNNLAADPVAIDPTTGRPIGGTNRFTLFSFKENKIITNTDSTTNKWDVGFRGTTIIVNGGAIRTGQGGVYIHTGLFDELKEIPTTATFAQDNSPTSLAITPQSGMGWYNYNPMINVVSPIPGRVLVVRTGDGKFAKTEILSYYKDAPAMILPTSLSRFYTFRFMYQEDGSRKLN